MGTKKLASEAFIESINDNDSILIVTKETDDEGDEISVVRKADLEKLVSYLSLKELSSVNVYDEMEYDYETESLKFKKDGQYLEKVIKVKNEDLTRMLDSYFENVKTLSKEEILTALIEAEEAIE